MSGAFQKSLELLFPRTCSDIYCGASIHIGWFPLVIPILQVMEQAALMDASAGLESSSRVVQIKEKWGGLRIYTSGESPHISALIDIAEELSYKTCEECGSPGKAYLVNGGWHRTLCRLCGPIDHKQRQMPIEEISEDWG